MLLTLCAIALAAVQVSETFQMPFDARDPASAKAWQERVRARLLEIVQAQNPKKDAPLDIKIGEFVQEKDFKRADASFMGNEGERIEVTLTMPREGDGPFPAIVCLHGHSGTRELAHDSTSIYHGFASEFARRGFVTIAPTLGHRQYAPNQLWNLMRLVDALEQLPYVDKTRIGAAGLSMGGEWTMWLTTCDLRIKAAVVSGWMCSTEGVLRVPNCPCWMPPGLLELCDIAEVNILMVPRPVLFESATEDACFPIDATRTGFEKIRKGYEVFGAAGKVRQHTFPGGHAWNGGEAYDFLKRYL